MTEATWSKDGYEVVKTADGREMRIGVLRAQESRKLMSKKRAFIKNLNPKRKAELYYKIYETLDKHTVEDKKEPLFQIGLSPYTFMQETVTIGRFQTTYGELFSRMHQAFNEVEMTFNVEEE